VICVGSKSISLQLRCMFAGSRMERLLRIR
jgi:hypothetical protein